MNSDDLRDVRPDLTDARLVEGVMAGEREWFRWLVERHEASVRAVTAGFMGCHRHDQIGDVVQAAFVIAYRKLDTLRDPAAFGPWVLRITDRECRRQLRSQRRHASQSLSEAAEPADPASIDSLHPEDWELLKVVNQLPMHERQVVTLRYFSAMSLRDVATATQRPLGTVSKQLSRALARLRELLLSED